MNKFDLLKKYGLNTYPSSIEINSQNIKNDSIFFALKGKFRDGHNFIADAVKRGAKIVIGTDTENGIKDNIQYIKIKDPINYLNDLAYDYYEEIINKLQIYGITGTNGKTSTTYFLREIFKRQKISTSIIGTIGNRIGNKNIQSLNTTPFSSELFKLFAVSHQNKIDNIIMEVSSHALKENRISKIKFDGIILTNISQDHLDFHKTFKNYIDSKMMIFDHIKEKTKIVMNSDCNRLTNAVKKNNINRAITYGKNGDFKLKRIKLSQDGSFYTFKYKRKIYETRLKMNGEFSIYNSLGAIALAVELGIDIKNAIAGVGDLAGVPGRYEVLRGRNFIVIIDYAHTDDALHNLLTSVREIPHNRIITIFGAGGDRDKTKRPKMGAVAEQLSDTIIVTSDNPRSEDPTAIIEDILDGLKNRKNAIVIEDREYAIRKGMKMANKHSDIVVIAGKGHEDYQIIGNTKHHFSDKEEVLKILNEN